MLWSILLLSRRNIIRYLVPMTWKQLHLEKTNWNSTHGENSFFSIHHYSALRSDTNTSSYLFFSALTNGQQLTRWPCCWSACCAQLGNIPPTLVHFSHVSFGWHSTSASFFFFFFRLVSRGVWGCVLGCLFVYVCVCVCVCVCVSVHWPVWVLARCIAFLESAPSHLQVTRENGQSRLK